MRQGKGGGLGIWPLQMPRNPIADSIGGIRQERADTEEFGDRRKGNKRETSKRRESIVRWGGSEVSLSTGEDNGDTWAEHRHGVVLRSNLRPWVPDPQAG